MSAFSDAAEKVTPKRGGVPCSVCVMLDSMDNQSRLDAIEAMAGPKPASWIADVFNAMGHTEMNDGTVGRHRRKHMKRP